jgi:histone-lysine N-methyltransferase SETMAR
MTTHKLENTGRSYKTRTVLPHPPYSPDLAPSDFHLLGALNDAIRGKRFGSDDEITEEAKKWLQVQDSDWYKTGIHDPVSSWRKVVKFTEIM